MKSNDKPKVMVIGAGRGQVPLIELYHKYGCYVIAVSIEGNYPGFAICDEAFYADIRDRERILLKAKESNIVAIATDQLDQSVPTVAYVAENLNIVGIGVDVARKFTDKYYMRQCAFSAGVRVPESLVVSNLECIEHKMVSAGMVFPVIMKPVDGSASNGIFLAECIDDLTSHFEYTKGFSATQRVIIERYIKGYEYVVETYTHDYVVNTLMVGQRDYFDFPGVFIPKATVFRDAISAVTNFEKSLINVNKQIITSFGLKFGITHAEYLVEESTGSIYLVEIAARGGGVSISSEIIPAVCGINANELLVRDTLCFPFVMPEMHVGAGAYFCFMLPEGEISSVIFYRDIQSIPGVLRVYLDDIKVGNKTKPIRDKYSRKGPIIVSGRSKDDCYRIKKELENSFSITVKTSDGLKGIIW